MKKKKTIYTLIEKEREALKKMEEGHFVIVSYGAQGLINPSLQLAQRLLRLRLRVTLLTTVFAHRRILSNANKADIPDGLHLAAFSDGYDDGFTIHSDDPLHLLSEIKRSGIQTLSHIVDASAVEGCPVTCLVNTLSLSWVSMVAREYQLTCALLWVQPCTALGIYYHYFNGFGDLIKENCTDPSWSINLPGLLPSLRGSDLPTFMFPIRSDFNELVLQTFRQAIDAVQSDEKPKVLVNSFEELEPEAFKSMAMLNPIGIGPLLPSAGESFRADLFRSTDEEGYRTWLESKPKSSVIYVSFGTLFTPAGQQMVEMGRGLLASNRPFLWVNRDIEKERGSDSSLGCLLEELENQNQGMIIPWACQTWVLSNPAVGCFVSHCGWNSVLESLRAGLAVVAIPQSSEQGTNARLVAEEFGTGERGKKNSEGIVEAEEIRRCIDVIMVMGEKKRGGGGGEDMIRNNSHKWKELVKDAMTSAERNLMEFVAQLSSSSSSKHAVPV